MISPELVGAIHAPPHGSRFPVSVGCEKHREGLHASNAAHASPATLERASDQTPIKQTTYAESAAELVRIGFEAGRRDVLGSAGQTTDAPLREVVREVMQAWDRERASWHAHHGTYDGFPEWFTAQVRRSLR